MIKPMTPKKPSIQSLNWYGWMNTNSGYGIVNLEYATALERQTGGVSIGWERMGDIFPYEHSRLTDEQRILMNKPYVKEKIGIIKTIPEMFYHNTSDFRIGYTMVENTKIGKRWVDWCNNMDAIFVPSPFLINVFKEGGVKPPVVSVKQGVDIRKFYYMERPIKDKYIFGTIGYIDERKNWQDLIQAFCSEFAPNEPVELWIKNTSPYFIPYGFSDPRIKIINTFYSFEKMKLLYRLFDCLVFPSHAEGSGLPPREAMATGLPVILTNWSGLSEVCNVDLNYPLTPVAIDVPDVRGPEQPGFMASIDITELMGTMRYVYEHREEAKEKGKKASEYIKNEWNWDTCALDLLTKLEDLC